MPHGNRTPFVWAGLWGAALFIIACFMGASLAVFIAWCGGIIVGLAAGGFMFDWLIERWWNENGEAIRKAEDLLNPTKPPTTADFVKELFGELRNRNIDGRNQ